MRTTRILPVVALAGIVALGATACSSGGDQQPSASPGGPGAITSLNVGVCVPNDADIVLPPYVADQKGLFTQEGLKVQVASFQGGSDLVKAMAGGTVDIGICTGIDAVSANANGIPMQVIAGIGGTNPSALMVPVDSKLTDITKLPASTNFGIARFGGATDFIARLTASKAGIPADQVKEAALGPDGLTAAVQAGGGGVDVFQWVPNSAITFISQGKLRTLAKVSDVFPDDQYSAILAQPDYISSHADTIKAFLAAFFGAVKLVQGDKAYGEQVIQDKLQVSQANASAVYDAVVPRWSPTGAVSTSGLATYVKYLPLLGVTGTAPSESDYYTSQFLPVTTN